MTKMKFTLAQLALETYRANPESPGYLELAKGLSGSREPNGALPAKRITLEDKFNLAVEKACLLPEAEIAAAINAIELKFPQLWIETVRPGCRLRTGCLFTQSTKGISMLLAVENSVEGWKAIGWRMPSQAYKIGDRALFSRPVHMLFGNNGVEWHEGDMNRSIALPGALHMAEQDKHAPGGMQKHVLADIRKQFTAADFMARGLLLLHSERLVDQAVFDETPALREERRLEGGRLRQAMKRPGSLATPCATVRYDIAAVARVATATGPRQITALLKLVDIKVSKSAKPRMNRKTGEPMRNKKGELIFNSGYTRKQRVSADYFERHQVVTASRPVDLTIENGRSVLAILPR